MAVGNIGFLFERVFLFSNWEFEFLSKVDNTEKTIFLRRTLAISSNIDLNLSELDHQDF